MLPIVIVDDDSDDLFLFERVLRRCKLLNPIQQFQNGIDCVKYFREQSESACLIFLDLQSPTNGIEVLRTLKGLGIPARIPIVLLSGVRHITTIQEGLELGAQTFFVKPVNREDVIRLLSDLPGIQIDEKPGGYSIRRMSTGEKRPGAQIFALPQDLKPSPSNLLAITEKSRPRLPENV